MFFRFYCGSSGHNVLETKLLHCRLFYVTYFTSHVICCTPATVTSLRQDTSAALWSQLRRFVAACWVEAFLWI